MKELEIVFTKSKQKLPILSWLIRLWTWKPYSHVAKAHEVKDWGKAYFQASGKVVNYEYHTEFDKHHEIVKSYKIIIPKEMRENINKECFKESGKPYGCLQNLGIVLVDLMRLLGKSMDNPFKGGKNCSELIYLEVLKQLKPELDYNPDTVKPHHIETIIKEHIEHTYISNH